MIPSDTRSSYAKALNGSEEFGSYREMERRWSDEALTLSSESFSHTTAWPWRKPVGQPPQA
jgi:hypothetical protein